MLATIGSQENLLAFSAWMKSHLMIVLGPLKASLMKALGPVMPYLLMAVEPTRIILDWTSYIAIYLFMVLLVGGALAVWIYNLFRMTRDITELQRSWTERRRRARCPICREVFSRRSSAERHFLMMHTHRQWNFYYHSLELAFPTLLLIMGIRLFLYCF